MLFMILFVFLLEFGIYTKTKPLRRLQLLNFTLQLDESADMTELFVLLVFVEHLNDALSFSSFYSQKFFYVFKGYRDNQLGIS